MIFVYSIDNGIPNRLFILWKGIAASFSPCAELGYDVLRQAGLISLSIDTSVAVSIGIGIVSGINFL